MRPRRWLATAEAEVAKFEGRLHRRQRHACPSPLRHDRLVEHIAAWQADLLAQGHTAKHAEQQSNRVRRLVAVMFGSPDALIDHRKLKPD